MNFKEALGHSRRRISSYFRCLHILRALAVLVVNLFIFGCVLTLNVKPCVPAATRKRSGDVLGCWRNREAFDTRSQVRTLTMPQLSVPEVVLSEWEGSGVGVTLSPVNHSDTYSQSWPSLSLCMWKRADSAFLHL